MKELLEGAPINKKLGPEYDRVIREFRAISAARNTYAHGQWWTDIRRKQTILDQTDDPNAPLRVRRVVTEEELRALNKRIFDLNVLIGHGPETELNRRQKAVSPRQATRRPKRSQQTN